MAFPCCPTEMLWMAWDACFLLNSLLSCFQGHTDALRNINTGSQHHTLLISCCASLKRYSSNFFSKLQKYRLFPTCRYPFLQFPVLHSGNGQDNQESKQQTIAQLIGPIAFSKTWIMTSFVYGLQRWWCYFHGDNTRKPTSRDAGGVISILHLCTPLKCAHCVFIVPMYAALCFHYRKNSHKADRLAMVLEEPPSQLFVQLMIKIIPSAREKKQYLCCRT